MDESIFWSINGKYVYSIVETFFNQLLFYSELFLIWPVTPKFNQTCYFCLWLVWDYGQVNEMKKQQVQLNLGVADHVWPHVTKALTSKKLPVKFSSKDLYQKNLRHLTSRDTDDCSKESGTVIGQIIFVYYLKLHLLS